MSYGMELGTWTVIIQRGYPRGENHGQSLGSCLWFVLSVPQVIRL